MDRRILDGHLLSVGRTFLSVRDCEPGRTGMSVLRKQLELDPRTDKSARKASVFQKIHCTGAPIRRTFLSVRYCEPGRTGMSVLRQQKELGPRTDKSARKASVFQKIHCTGAPIHCTACECAQVVQRIFQVDFPDQSNPAS